MAKTFDPSQLSPADQAAYTQWQQQLRQYVAANGGGVPAPITYALLKPDYIKDHPELQEGYDIVSGANLPPAVKEAVKGYHPVWGDAQGKGDAGMSKDKGLFGNWETWLQLGLGATVGGVAAAGLAGAAGAPAAGSAGGGSVAAGTGAAGAGTAATSAYGPLAGGYGAATTSAAVPASLAAAPSGAAALVPSTITGLTTPGVGTVATTPAFAAGGSTDAPSIFWDKIFGKTAADKALTAGQIGANLAGSIIQSRQASKAAEAEQAAAEKALALQSNIYQQQRADLAPYRNAGSSSLSALTYGLGLDPSKSADTTTPYFQQQAQAQNNAVPQNAQRNPNSPATQPIQAGNYTGGTAVPRTSLTALSSPSSGMVAMRSPDGRPAQVPQNQVQAALAAGGSLA